MKNLYKSNQVPKSKGSAAGLKNSRLRVGIEYNKYFTKEKWQKKIKDLFPTVNHYCQIIFYINKYDGHSFPTNLGVICTTWLDNDYIKRADRLKWIHVMTAGCEFLEEIENLNDIRVTSTSGISAEGVAEYVLCVCLALLRNLNYAFNNQHRKEWKQGKFLEKDAELLKTKRVGILGLGNNGRAVAKTFKTLGCEVFGLARELFRLDYVDRVYSSDDLDKIIQNSDILVVCLPLTSETRVLITLRELRLLGSGGFLINVARGQIVNESDLVYALSSRIIRGAALDVFNEEPLSPSSPLWECPNAIITPHIAGNINNYVDKIQISFIRELKSYVSE